MAINKVFFPNSVPVDDTDWSKMVLQQQFIALGINNPVNYDFTSDTIKQGSMFIAGQSVYLAESDTAITGTPSNYVKLTVSGDTLVPSYVTDLTGVTWNSSYNHYGDVSVNAYAFDEMLAVYNGAVSDPKTISGRISSLKVSDNIRINNSKTLSLRNVANDGEASLRVDASDILSVRTIGAGFELENEGGTNIFSIGETGDILATANMDFGNQDYIFFRSTGASKAQLGVRSDNQFLLESASGGFTFQDNLNTKNVLRIAETGDATFSDDIELSSSVSFLKNTGNDMVGFVGKSIHSQTTDNAIFDFLAPYIPNTGDEIRCSGGLDTVNVSHAIRSTGTSITIYGILVNNYTVTTRSVTDGGVVTIEASITI